MKYSTYFPRMRSPLRLIVMLILVGCAGPYTYTNNNSTIELSEDDPFQIVLKGATESDYDWQLISENTFVKLQKPVTITTDSEEKIYTFDFKTLSSGNQEIDMIYTNGSDIENTFHLDVIIGSIGLITSDLK